MTLETRTLTRPVEVRAAGDSGRTIAGYAAVFGSTADIGDSFREIIAPGAFSGALGGDVVALIGHDRNRVLGRTTAGTLRLREDDTGLAVEIDLPDTTDGRNLAVLIERGDVSGMSFGFVVTKQRWDETGPVPTRTIEAVDLREVTVTAFPAYDDTSIALRSLDDARKEHRKHHNQSGYSLRKARTEMTLRGL
jgi:HK97 family phage prohead protease